MLKNSNKRSRRNILKNKQQRHINKRIDTEHKK